jgi:hypothetical protein
MWKDQPRVQDYCIRDVLASPVGQTEDGINAAVEVKGTCHQHGLSSKYTMKIMICSSTGTGSKYSPFRWRGRWLASLASI